MPPIDDTLTPKQREVLSELQSYGTDEIQNRLKAIAKARDQINSDRSLTAYKRLLNNRLDATSARLKQLQLRIAKETLVDGARADIKLMYQVRVYGLVLDQATPARLRGFLADPAVRMVQLGDIAYNVDRSP